MPRLTAVTLIFLERVCDRTRDVGCPAVPCYHLCVCVCVCVCPHSSTGLPGVSSEPVFEKGLSFELGPQNFLLLQDSDRGWTFVRLEASL